MTDYEEMTYTQLVCAAERIIGALYTRGRMDERHDYFRCYQRDVDRAWCDGFITAWNAATHMEVDDGSDG